MSIEALVADISYKPGWKLSVEDGPHGPMLLVRASVVDAYNPAKMTTINAGTIVPHGIERDIDQAMRWVYSCLRAVEIHELGEFFVYRGRRPYDPH
jgi:hypothetical protein